MWVAKLVAQKSLSSHCNLVEAHDKKRFTIIPK
jgi:hypothetical protein